MTSPTTGGRATSSSTTSRGQSTRALPTLRRHPHRQGKAGTNIHPTEKPQGLLNILIDYSTVEGQFVFDPYAGSGSTVLAAASMGRTALGIESDERYIDLARARLPLPGLFSL